MDGLRKNSRLTYLCLSNFPHAYGRDSRTGLGIIETIDERLAKNRIAQRKARLAAKLMMPSMETLLPWVVIKMIFLCLLSSEVVESVSPRASVKAVMFGVAEDVARNADESAEIAVNQESAVDVIREHATKSVPSKLGLVRVGFALPLHLADQRICASVKKHRAHLAREAKRSRRIEKIFFSRLEQQLDEEADARKDYDKRRHVAGAVS